MNRLRHTFALSGALLVVGYSTAQAQLRVGSRTGDVTTPAGMCRIWLEGVPASRQPAPTDCATARAHASDHARVIYGPGTDRSRDDRYDPRRDPRTGTSDPRRDPRSGTYDPRRDSRTGTYDPRRDPRYDPRAEQARDRWDRKDAKAREKAERKQRKEWEKARKHDRRDRDDDDRRRGDRGR